MSSISTMRTLGAPFGASTTKRGGGVASRASKVVIDGTFGSGMGSTVRSVGVITFVWAATCLIGNDAASNTSISNRAVSTTILFMVWVIAPWCGKLFLDWT